MPTSSQVHPVILACFADGMLHPLEVAYLTGKVPDEWQHAMKTRTKEDIARAALAKYADSGAKGNASVLASPDADEADDGLSPIKPSTRGRGGSMHGKSTGGLGKGGAQVTARPVGRQQLPHHIPQQRKIEYNRNYKQSDVDRLMNTGKRSLKRRSGTDQVAQDPQDDDLHGLPDEYREEELGTQAEDEEEEDESEELGDDEDSGNEDSGKENEAVATARGKVITSRPKAQAPTKPRRQPSPVKVPRKGQAPTRTSPRKAARRG